MAKAAKGRLKVYRAEQGFFESVVAAPNQQAALDAWGVRQNLFAEGLASTTDEAAAVKAALATPGRPVLRPLGSKAAFKVEPALPDAPKAPARQAANGAAAKPAKAERTSPPPDRTALDAAEAALAAAEAEREAGEADFAKRRRDLERDYDAARRAWARGAAKAGTALARARAAWERAGGKP